MKIGVASTCLWSFKPKELISFAVKNELYSVEFWIDHLQLFEISYVEIRKLLEKSGIISTVHSISWDINICSFSRDVREFSLKEVKKSIDIAEEIGAELVVVHPGKMSFVRGGETVFFNILIGSIMEIYEYAQKKGIMLCIENMEPLKKELLVSWKDFHEFYSKIDKGNIYITMDLAHLGSYKKIKDFYKNLSDRIVHIHISDLTRNQMHVPLGEGRLPLTRIIKFLRDYRGIYSIEFFNNGNNLEPVIRSVKLLNTASFKTTE